MDSGVVFKKKNAMKIHTLPNPSKSSSSFVVAGFEMIPIQGSFFRAANMFIFFKRPAQFA